MAEADLNNQLLPTPNQPDINLAAALRAQYAIETPKLDRRRKNKKLTREEVHESLAPLIDTTQTLQLHSKKLERLHKREQKKVAKAAAKSASVVKFLDLPSEVLIQVLESLPPSSIFKLARTSRSLHELIEVNQIGLARSIIQARYSILLKCFPLPIAFEDVDPLYRGGLLSERRLQLLNIHRKSYHQHIELIDPMKICTCMTCVFAWNNLCLLVDLAHWQGHLNSREPIPMIPRGSNPDWNQNLLKRNADVVRKAIANPLWHASILEAHLNTITGTIYRCSHQRKFKGAPPTAKKQRLYRMTEADAELGTDAFLSRSGPPSYDFPFHRDNYYSLEVYLPNRKWGEADKQWHYYASSQAQHERDLEWVKQSHDAQNKTSSWEQMRRREAALRNLAQHNTAWASYMQDRQMREVSQLEQQESKQADIESSNKKIDAADSPASVQSSALPV